MMMWKVPKYRFYEWMVAACVFFNGLGFVIYFAGINIVNVLSLTAFAAIIIDVMKKDSMKQLLQNRKKFFFLLFFFVWVLYALLQLKFLNVSKQEYLIVFRQLVTNTLFVYFVGYTVHNKNSFNLIQKAMIGVLIVNVGIGMFEVITGIHFMGPESIWDAEHTRAFSRNPNEYATTVYCALVCLVFPLFYRKIRWKEILLIVFSFICILTSHCRGILYAVVLFAFMYGSMKLFYYIKGKAVLAKGLVIIGLIILGFLALQGNISKLLVWFVKSFSGQGDYESDMYRLSLINQGMDFFKKTRGLGVGAGQSIYLIKMNLHNFFVEILVEYGILIFAGVVMIMWSIWKKAFDLSIPKNVRCIYFALMPSLIMASIVSSSINKFKIFWVMIFLFYLSDEYLIEKTKTGKVSFYEVN